MASMQTKFLEKTTTPVERAERLAEDGYGENGLTYDEFERLLGAYDDKLQQASGPNEFAEGTVVSMDGKGAWVDIGAKSLAFCPVAELSNTKVMRPSEVLTLGMTRTFAIVRQDYSGGFFIVSNKPQESKVAWKRIRQLLAEDVTVNAKVVDSNRGGLIVEVEGQGGFCPTSHLSPGITAANAIGMVLPVKFLEVDEERTRLVMSNRLAAEQDQPAFEVGDVLLGTVQAIHTYGAFVNIGSANGLLHISQISHDRITAVENVLQEKQEIKVMILSQDKDRGRISLSTKKLEPTPGDMVRNPQLVFDKAEEMAATFRRRVAAAEAAARAEEERLAEEVAAAAGGAAPVAEAAE